jgi:hypothetical protein
LPTLIREKKDLRLFRIQYMIVDLGVLGYDPEVFGRILFPT